MTSSLPTSKPPAEVHPMQALLEQGGYDMPQRGDIREGTVLSVNPQEIIIDLGLKREGIVPANDLSRLDPEMLAEVQEGTVWPVYILQPSDRDGNLIVSLSRAIQEKDWLVAQQMMDSGEIFEAQVSGHNAGGLEVIFGKLRGFVPASHISTLPRNASEDERRELLAAYAGQTIPVKVVEVDRRRRRLIMSERAAHRRWQREHRKQLLDEIEVGEVRTGIVRSLANFGAFVDLGGADGLIHISELAWFPVNHPGDVVKVGEKVEVKVLRIDKGKERVGLSLKRVQPDPWSHVEADYNSGELVEAVVTRVTDFGAFVRLRSGVEGLLHVTEMADIRPDHPQSLVSPGDLLLLRVIRVESQRRRIGLSLRQVSESEWASWAASYREKAAQETEADTTIVKEEAEDVISALEDAEADAEGIAMVAGLVVAGAVSDLVALEEESAKFEAVAHAEADVVAEAVSDLVALEEARAAAEAAAEANASVLADAVSDLVALEESRSGATTEAEVATIEGAETIVEAVAEEAAAAIAEAEAELKAIDEAEIIVEAVAESAAAGVTEAEAELVAIDEAQSIVETVAEQAAEVMAEAETEIEAIRDAEADAATIAMAAIEVEDAAAAEIEADEKILEDAAEAAADEEE